MKTFSVYNSSRFLLFSGLILVQLLTAPALVSSVKSTTDASDDGETVNICTDGTCSCDNIEPFLISCIGNTLDKLYDDVEWVHTIETNKLENRSLDFRVDKNRITEIPRFPKLKITTLSFRNNKISSIAAYAFADVEGLVALDLSQNQLTAKSLTDYTFRGILNNDTFYKPIGLQHLNLSYNQIHSIEADVFDHLPELTSLDLSNNPLKVLGSTASALGELRNLKTLTMANAELKTIPDALFHDLMHLEYLDLSGNKFTEVPREILNTHDLRVLNLDNNLFESLNEDSFHELDTLQILSISHIPTLKLIEKNTFGTLYNLTVLKCHHNRQLSRISDSAFYKITETDEEWPVKEIYLNDNALSNIDREFAAWQMVQYIDIQNNPFRCNCDVQWMAQVLVQQIVKTHSHLAENIKCSEPEALKGADIVELGLEDKQFSRCKQGSMTKQLLGARRERPVEAYQGAGITILIIGVILTTIGLTVLGVIIIKRRAIAAALIAHHEIRYQKADTYDDDTPSYRSPSTGSAYKVVV